MPGFKVIHDAVHGTVKVDGLFLDLLKRPEMQRLHGIHQLGLAYLVFPGANHTRLEHSLGTYYIASELSTSLELEQEDRLIVRAAAMLHDIGHTPFSHTLEEVLHHHLGKDHMDVSKDIIVGDLQPYRGRDPEVLGDIPPLSEVLERGGADPGRVADLVTSAHRHDPAQRTLMVDGEQAHFGQPNFLHQIISGPLDVDQMDYLLRDSYYTGVAHGTIDTDRLMQTFMVHHGDLVVQKGGLVAVEGLLVARALMYTSVYFHKTVRIAEMMLCKAVEAAPPEVMEEAFVDSDTSFSAKLVGAGGACGRLMAMLRYRHLYKKALMLPHSRPGGRADQSTAGAVRLPPSQGERKGDRGEGGGERPRGHPRCAAERAAAVGAPHRQDRRGHTGRGPGEATVPLQPSGQGHSVEGGPRLGGDGVLAPRTSRDGGAGRGQGAVRLSLSPSSRPAGTAWPPGARGRRRPRR